MEVDTDCVDVSVGFNEFEAEFAVSTKDEEGQHNEQEMEIDGAKEIAAQYPAESNTSVVEVNVKNGPRQDAHPSQERCKSNRRSRSSRRNGNCSEAKSNKLFFRISFSLNFFRPSITCDKATVGW